jgi:hypothetical protein
MAETTNPNPVKAVTPDQAFSNAYNRSIVEDGVGCWKKKPWLGTWEKRKVKIRDDGIKPPALLFYNLDSDWVQGGKLKAAWNAFLDNPVGSTDVDLSDTPRGSSILDVRDYTVVKFRGPGFSKTTYLSHLNLTPPTEKGEGVMELAFENQDHRDKFYDALIENGAINGAPRAGGGTTKRRKRLTKRRKRLTKGRKTKRRKSRRMTRKKTK